MSFHATRSFFHLSRVCTVCISSFTFPVFARCAFLLSPFPCLHGVHSFFHLSRVCTVCILSFIFFMRFHATPVLCFHTHEFVFSPFLWFYSMHSFFLTYSLFSFTFPVCSHVPVPCFVFFVFHTTRSFFHLSCVFPLHALAFNCCTFSHCVFTLLFRIVFTSRFYIAFSERT